MVAIPRLVVAAPGSGHGKTTVATGLLRVLAGQGMRAAGFKVGPDYIDPSYHELACGRPGRNLDPVLVGEDLILPLFAHGAAGSELAVVEGVMGLYDGRSGAGDFGSTAHVAQLLAAPIVLVVDASAQGRSIAALLHGFQTFGRTRNSARHLTTAPRHAASVGGPDFAAGLGGGRALGHGDVASAGALEAAAGSAGGRALGHGDAASGGGSHLAARSAGGRVFGYGDAATAGALEAAARSAGGRVFGLGDAASAGALEAAGRSAGGQSAGRHAAHGEAADAGAPIVGVILNRVGSDRHEQLLREACAEVGMPVLGVLRRRAMAAVPSRHLGLVPVAERTPEAREAVEAMAALVAAGVDVPALLALAHSAPPLPSRPWSPPVTVVKGQPIVAVAGGPAFSFGYREQLELLAAAGADVRLFDPLRDEQLPPGTAAVVINGGFPEVYGEQLAANVPLRRQVRELAVAGAPIVAECAGLLWLGRMLDGHEMCGVLDAVATMTDHLTLGYRDAVAVTSSVIADSGARVTGHEFHRTRTTPECGPRPAWSGASGGFVQAGVHASYLHTHWAGNPGFAQRFVEAAAARAAASAQPTGSRSGAARAVGLDRVLGSRLETEPRGGATRSVALDRAVGPGPETGSRGEAAGAVGLDRAVGPGPGVGPRGEAAGAVGLDRAAGPRPGVGPRGEAALAAGPDRAAGPRPGAGRLGGATHVVRAARLDRAAGLGSAAAGTVAGDPMASGQDPREAEWEGRG